MRKVVFCQPELPEGLKHANASFWVVYKLEMGRDGSPSEITKVSDDYLRSKALDSCFSQWRIPGMPAGSSVAVSLYWKHGVGWVEMRIAGASEVNEVITRVGEMCPYRGSD